MAQLFSPRANFHSRLILAVIVLFICGAGWATSEIFWSPYTTYVGIPFKQPVPFSHQHHVAGLGIDCRYCHTGVETSAFAGLPPTETCMTCHSQLWTEAPLLQPVRASMVNNKPIKWTRVHDLPDFVYFNHSIHVAKGVGCSTCHGQVDAMPLTWKTQTLYMRWCIDCHQAPQKYLRRPDQIYNMSWKAPADQASLGQKLATQYHVDLSGRLINCSTCHR
jgi:hypothetical protein